LNSFNLTNALYDRIGLYLHPYAALINHSCNYNSVVGFDGDELIIKAVRPIQKGEQIFISYIDTTNPVKLRRTELHDRYFFTCHCANCEKELSAPDAHAQIHADAPALQAAEQNAYDLLTECASPSDLEPEDTVQRLESTIQSLHQTYSWPVTRQPLVSLRDELIASLLSAGKFNSAFVHAAARYLRVDPVVYESESHPIRHLHAWTLARLAIHLSGGMDVCDDRAALEKSELNFSLVIWAVLGRLVEKEGDSCTVPGFKRMVREAFGEVHREFVSGGLDPRSMEGDIRREWERLGRIVDTVLEKGC
jgi:SET and MYND domain-containing protein